MTVRLAKIVLSLTLAAFALVVAYDNLIDYGSNFAFVQHVLSMDTTFPGNALLDRAIARPWMWHAGYVVIIAGEALTGVLLLAGSVVLWRARHRSSGMFQAAKSWVVAGCTVGFVVWFFGFMVVGGEWFAMWQSKVWNGQEGAFRFYMAIIGVLVFVNQADGELDVEHRR
jgi:predicted small integral membrane protein